MQCGKLFEMFSQYSDSVLSLQVTRPGTQLLNWIITNIFN